MKTVPTKIFHSAHAVAATLLALTLFHVPGAKGQAGGDVTVAPVVAVGERAGITGAGWGVAFEAPAAGRTARKILNIYPNHPDDWGKTAGTGSSYSLDGGRSWIASADNTPIAAMVDLWVDRLPGNELVALGIRILPEPKKPVEPGPDGIFRSIYTIGYSRDAGQSWRMETATVESSRDIGPIARPLPHIFADGPDTWLMPAYSWGKGGSRALLLRSTDRGRIWRVAGTIATAAAINTMGVPVRTPWFENMVERTADGSLLAAIRTASNARGALMLARSSDRGATWSAPEKMLAGPQQRIVPGKLPNLVLLRNGALVLLTAHSKNHCRLYVSWDGRGRTWSEGYVITSQTGGNTSMVAIDDNQLMVFTPATARISAWTVTVKPSAAAPAAATAVLPAPARLQATPTAKGVALSWSRPDNAADVARYRVTPVLEKAPDPDAEIYPYLPIETVDAATSLRLEHHLLPGATYRFEVAAVSPAGRSSAPARSELVVAAVVPAAIIP